MCSKRKYYEECLALLKTEISGDADSTGNSTASSKSPILFED
jgi:hypothetical protein